MFPIDLKRTILLGIPAFLLCLLFAACTSGPVSNTTPTQPSVVQGTSIASTPGVGPTVILTPTRVPGGNTHSQLVTLPDRILTISSISKQAGTDNSSIAISLTLTIKNTGAKTISNDATYFVLTGAEGDAFGLQSGTNTNFFGAIASQNSRTGTIIFQIPAGAMNGLRLLYRPEVATETTFVPLNLP